MSAIIKTAEEIERMRVAGRLAAAGEEVLPEEQTVCCYHVSDKAWVLDPQALRWETFLTHEEATVYGENFEELESRRQEKKVDCC